jgi:hypothetical protein
MMVQDMVRKVTECDLLPEEVVQWFFVWEYFEEEHEGERRLQENTLSDQVFETDEIGELDENMPLVYVSDE